MSSVFGETGNILGVRYRDAPEGYARLAGRWTARPKSPKARNVCIDLWALHPVGFWFRGAARQRPFKS